MVSPQTGPRVVSSVEDRATAGVCGFLQSCSVSGLFALRATASGRADGKGTAIGTIGIEQMAKVSPVKFFKEVRDEVRKVTWPSRRETTITTIMVFAFAFVAAVFFLLADQVIRATVTLLLGIGS
jgi:preprotein translocase subunit SecE